MILFIHWVRRFAPALPLRGTSLREDGLREATDAVDEAYHAAFSSMANPSRYFRSGLIPKV